MGCPLPLRCMFSLEIPLLGFLPVKSLVKYFPLVLNYDIRFLPFIQLK